MGFPPFFCELIDNKTQPGKAGTKKMTIDE